MSDKHGTSLARAPVLFIQKKGPFYNSHTSNRHVTKRINIGKHDMIILKCIYFYLLLFIFVKLLLVYYCESTKA